ncbi:hypothetical protein [Bifidobacterium stellenboschense]|uniref:Putative membrane protein n=1 Tax=Bifidobacterium stellenboschense TaxID=762211 RepID=A0A087DG17_9BIFI|nr:hypothetical protein [Bifidobacterium stellenboschense]KFI94467.1 putative membrane protein [Bifidobacterium stellenboschense]
MPYFVKRLIRLLSGLAVESFGIALITKSGLGTSPISGIAWVVTLRFPQISLFRIFRNFKSCISTLFRKSEESGVTMPYVSRYRA